MRRSAIDLSVVALVMITALGSSLVACNASDETAGGGSRTAGTENGNGNGGSSNGNGSSGGSNDPGKSDGGSSTAPWVCTTDCSHCGPLEECAGGKFCVPKSVSIKTPAGTSYTIDATEVTRCQYAAWLATKPSVDGQGNWCRYQTTFEPDTNCMSTQVSCKSNCDQHPQVCVTSCDAEAFCKAVGKRLCGQPGGAHAPFEGFDDANEDQWYNACSGGGKNTYPYSDDYDGKACNGYDNPQTGCQAGTGCDTRPGGEVTTCQSAVAGYAGVYDLSGNVFEWQDSCDKYEDGKDRCRFRGGSYISSYGDDNGNALRCNYDIAGSRDDAYGNLGFRCCSQ